MEYMAFQGKHETIVKFITIKDFNEKYDKSVKDRICNIQVGIMNGG